MDNMNLPYMGRLQAGKLSTLFGIMLLVMGCQPVVDIQPTLESIQTHVFDKHCLFCHGATNPIHGIDLSAGQSLFKMLYVTSFMEPPLNIIEAGDPDNSLLVRKLEFVAQTSGMPMLPFPPIPQYKRDAVRTWIENMEPIPQPTLTYLQRNVFDVNCATSNCHAGDLPALGLDLSAGKSVINMVGVPSKQSPALNLIEPGDPDNSYLMKKLEGTGDGVSILTGKSRKKKKPKPIPPTETPTDPTTNVGVQMPIGRPPLGPADLDAVRNWIVSLRGPQPNIDWIQENIYDISCAYSGCHDGTNILSRLDLRKNVAEANTINVPSVQVPSLNFITPGNAAESYLMKKIDGSTDIKAVRMPWFSPALTQEKIDVVRLYINNLGQPTATLEPTLISIQSQVFDVNCATGGCHDAVSAASGLDLSAGNAYNNLVSVTSGQASTLNLVEPGLPDSSYLIQKLEGNAAIGSRMPTAQPALRPDVINAIRQWVLTL